MGFQNKLNPKGKMRLQGAMMPHHFYFKIKENLLGSFYN